MFNTKTTKLSFRNIRSSYQYMTTGRALFFFLLSVTLLNAQNRDSEFYELLSDGNSLINGTSIDTLRTIEQRCTQMVSGITNDSLLGKYHIFLSRVALRSINDEDVRVNLERALYYGKNSNTTEITLNAYHDLCDFYVNNENFIQAEKYKDSLYGLLKTTRSKKNKLLALAMIARYFSATDQIEISKSYHNECLELDPEYAPCKLILANYEMFKTDKWTNGLQILWEILLNDPEISQMTTVWSLQTLIRAYIEAFHFTKAEELINLVLAKKANINQRGISEFLELNGDLYKQMGATEEAFEFYGMAIQMNPGFNFKSRVTLKIFLEKRTKMRSLTGVDADLKKLLKSSYAKDNVYLRIYKLLDSMNPDFESDNFTESKQILKKTFGDSQLYIGAYEKKQIYEIIALNFFGTATPNSSDMRYFDAYLQEVSDVTAERSERTNKFMDSRLGYFEDKIFESDVKLEEKELEITTKEEARKRAILGLTVSLIILTLTMFILLQSKRNQRRIKSLSENLENNNKELLAYSKDYEFMLLTLSHHVKEPVNQFKHGIEILKTSYEKGGTQSLNDIDFVLNTMHASNKSLSSRISSLLTFLKNRVDKKSIKITPIDVQKLMVEKVEELKPLAFEIQTDANVPYMVNQSLESLDIVVDNLLENVIKYGVDDELPIVSLEKIDGNVSLEIKNKVSKNSKNKLQKLVHPSEKRSFGLGFLIVRLLCTELGIDFKSEIKSEYFLTTLRFKS